MKNSTARKLEQLPKGALMVGIDPHKKRHAAVVMTREARVLERFQVATTAAGFGELCSRVDQLVARQGAGSAVYGMEAGGHYWMTLAYHLETEEQPFHLVNPFTLKRRREGEDLDRRKNDFRDATMAAELLRTGHYTDTQLAQGAYAELRAAHGGYRRACEQRTRTVNLLRAQLDKLFPEFCGVFKEVTGITALAVLSLTGAPKEVAALSCKGLERGVRECLRGRRVQVRELVALQEAARGSVGVQAGAASMAMEVRQLVRRLRIFQGEVEQWEEQLLSLVQELPEYSTLHSIPGLGALAIAGMLAELGPIARYGNAKQLIKMAGTNPTQAESAGKRSTHTPMSKKGRPGLRSCLWMTAVRMTGQNQEFRAWAKALRERPAHPLKKREVLGAVMNRLLRVAFGLVKRGEAYDPEKGRRAKQQIAA